MNPRTTTAARAVAPSHRSTGEPGRPRRGPRLPLVVAACCFALLIATPRADAAFTDLQGAPVPNTSTSGPTTQLAGPPSVVRTLATPNTPADDDAQAVGALGSPNSPEDDLDAALADLAAAPDVATALDARQRALDILEGNPVSGRAYSGMPLLNWNVPARVRQVPAGGEVTVNVVRFGEHVLCDTWLLQFADPAQPFTVRYRIAELGDRFGGTFSPTPLLSGTAGGDAGMNAAVLSLAGPLRPLGTQTTSRFHPTGADELGRRAVQEVVVRMPPARMLRAVLDPDLAAGHRALASIVPATPARIAAAQAAFGFAGAAPTAQQRTDAIARIGDAAPEKLLWTDLRALDPLRADVLQRAQQLGVEDRPLLGTMRNRTELPPGTPDDRSADVSIAIANDETYVSVTSLHLAPGQSVTVSVANLDGFDHAFSASELRARDTVFGQVDWGVFRWGDLAAGGGAPTLLRAHDRQTFVLQPSNDAFALWLGDQSLGDQAATTIAIAHGPVVESVRFAPDATPGQVALHPDGSLWAAARNVDKLVHVVPAAPLAASTVQQVLVPNGRWTLQSPMPLRMPADVGVDARGIVWSTLFDGNAVVRVDPSRVVSGTTSGTTVTEVDPCPECPPPAPPPFVDPRPPTTGPQQLAVVDDGNGNTVVWFVEVANSKVAAMRFGPDGTLLDKLEAACECNTPSGMALGPDGSVWYAGIADNAIHRLVVDPAHPWDASRVRIERFPIPSGVAFPTPKDPFAPPTAGAHELSVDPLGRIWFVEELTGRLGMLDPALARDGTSDGLRELPMRANAFRRVPSPTGIALDRAARAYWTDEYGDEVGAMDAADGEERFTPPARNSLTGSPVVDTRGAIWFVEAGAHLLTRIAGVATPTPPPFVAPVFEADPVNDTLVVRGAPDGTAIGVTVRRAGAVVATGHAPLSAGVATIVPSAWSGGAGDPLQAGDAITVALEGGLARAPVTFDVADLSLVVGKGNVSGEARVGGLPAADRVRVDVGTQGGFAGVDPRTGAFTFDFTVALRHGVTPIVSWSHGTAAGIFRTVAQARAAASEGGTVPPPAPITRPAPVGATPLVTPGGASATTHLVVQLPGFRPCAAAAAGWLQHAGARFTVGLLGWSDAQLRACIGAPAATRAVAGGRQRSTFAAGIEVVQSHGTVTALVVTAPVLATRGGVTVGARLDQVRQLVGAAAWKRATWGAGQVVVSLGSSVRVRIALRTDGRIARIEVWRNQGNDPAGLR